MSDKKEGTWGISDVWNPALADREEREMVKRDHVWASELGAPPVDVWLKMRATPYTNPANDRSKRKFEAGNVMEWMVTLMLKRAGILRSTQERCEHQYEGLLKVTGKADQIAGGKIDDASAAAFMQFLVDAEMPDVFIRCFERISAHLKATYPNGMDEMPLEVKSVSSFAMDKMEIQGAPIARHRKQIFHYLKAKGYGKGLIIYVCRDDLRMMEFAVFNPSSVEEEYKADIAALTKFVMSDTMPPKEKMVIFDVEQGKFTKNLGVEWSPYLTMLYDFKEPREYSEVFGKMATNFNRVMKRVMEAKKMTDKNLEVIQQIQNLGFDVESLKSQFRMVENGDEEETVVNGV